MQRVVSNHRITQQDHSTLLCHSAADYRATIACDEGLIYAAQALTPEPCPTCGSDECFCRPPEVTIPDYEAMRSCWLMRKAA
jgi:hypothetical protein